MAFLSREQLEQIGFESLGVNVLISDKASLYNVSKISIGSHVRIDDFCVLSAGEGGIKIGNYTHIAVFCSLMGNGHIELSDFSGLSSRVSIYTSNDDYSGSSLTNPMIPEEYKNVQSADVKLHKHVIVGSGSIILPGVTLNEGVAVGALSLVTKDCGEYKIYSGVPARPIKARKKDLKTLEMELLKAQ
ncbi:acyltransferase [Oceanimonas doudoroffii]|uniref:Galactoside O-acetyltransferase n=1 Tax=Oceanimonas doudoroffii TaxID=84158 RepID=A0A233RER5_9GAMM|nr:acyltransferase [Oceanimonas doudoroffii]OXY81880.1 galactoside O-acetyltransferase [Oceanimonas doudoroffii]